MLCRRHVLALAADESSCLSTLYWVRLIRSSRISGCFDFEAAHQKPIAEVDDKTLILADQAEKAIVQMRHEVGELLADRYPSEKAEERSPN